MAGRPAAGGTTGIVVGMGVAIAVAVIALVLLVVLWTNQEELKSEASKATQELQLVGNPRTFGAWFDQATAGAPMAKRMETEMLSLAQAISPSATTAAPGMLLQIARNELEPLWNRMGSEKIVEQPTDVVGRPLSQGLASLYDAFSKKHEQYTQAQAEIRQLQGQHDALVAANTELKTSFEQTASELHDKLASIEQQWNAFRETKTAEFAQIEKNTLDRSNEANLARQELRNQIDAVSADLAKKEERVQELQDKVREFQILPQPRMAARQADGHILRAEPGQRCVFVDLGIENHLTLGLRFAVYSPDTGIPSSGEAKAAVEVVSIGDEVSECRIAWMDPLNPILEGDLVANPIYDQNRRLSFLVIGAYDLDHDGRDDPAGKDNVEAVIKDAGGTLVDALSSRTDFVIVGARPLVRDLPPDADEEHVAAHAEAKRFAEQYASALQEAMALSVPILTQETFLNFMARRH